MSFKPGVKGREYNQSIKNIHPKSGGTTQGVPFSPLQKVGGMSLCPPMDLRPCSLVICNEEDTGGPARMTADEERTEHTTHLY